MTFQKSTHPEPPLSRRQRSAVKRLSINPASLDRLPPLPKPARNGCIFLASGVFTSPEAAAIPPRAAVVWVYGLSWVSQMRRETLGVLPDAVANSIADEATSAALVRSGLWVRVDGGFHCPTESRAGRPLWKPGPTPDRRAKISDRVRQAVYARDGHACVECASSADLSLDHIHPWSLGGSDNASNLRTLCRSCNSRKGARI